MKNIEDIIKDNREVWNSSEPVEGHFERFSAKLELREKTVKTPKRIVVNLLKVAVVTLLVTLSSLWTWERFIKFYSRGITLSEVSPQYREVENYYIYQVNLLENEIRNTTVDNDPGQQQALISELQNMDTVYVSLQRELRANPNDERVINAMIDHYQKKLDAMTFIVDQLKEIKYNQINNREYEKVSL